MNRKLKKIKCCSILKVSVSGKLIYSLQASNFKKEIVLSQKEIGQMLGMSKSSVNKNLQKLKKAGYIDVFHQFDVHGRHNANKYKIRW